MISGGGAIAWRCLSDSIRIFQEKTISAVCVILLKTSLNRIGLSCSLTARRPSLVGCIAGIGHPRTSIPAVSEPDTTSRFIRRRCSKSKFEVPAEQWTLSSGIMHVNIPISGPDNNPVVSSGNRCNKLKRQLLQNIWIRGPSRWPVSQASRMETLQTDTKSLQIAALVPLAFCDPRFTH